MSIIDKIMDGNWSGSDKPKQRGIPPNATFRLTQEGRSKLQSFSGDPKERVLMAVEGEESYTMDEVASRSRMPRGRVERLLEVLVKQGYVQISGGGSRIADEGLED